MPTRRRPRPKIRLGGGARTHPDEQRLRARVEYLATIRRLRPHVLCDLRDAVFPALAAGGVDAVGARVGAWAARWNLVDPWIVYAAVRTLMAWAVAPQLLETDPPKWQYSGEAVLVVPRPGPPPLVVGGWDSEAETRAAFDARWRRARVAHVRAVHARSAWPATRAVPPTVVEWLVRRIVPRPNGAVEDPREITARHAREDADYDAVRQAIRRLAADLDLSIPALCEADD